jgi:hypothetical protein
MRREHERKVSIRKRNLRSYCRGQTYQPSKDGRERAFGFADASRRCASFTTFHGPGGETWSGRGAPPRWLVAAMKETGKKREEFLIDAAAKSAKKVRRKKK